MKKILVVDDEPDVLDLAKATIEPRHTVEGASSAERALELLGSGEFWLLITDIRMPHTSGFSLIQRAKTLQPRLAVVILSAFYDENDGMTQEVVRRYADVALAKPFSAQTLNEAINCLLGDREARGV